MYLFFIFLEKISFYNLQIFFGKYIVNFQRKILLIFIFLFSLNFWHDFCLVFSWQQFPMGTIRLQSVSSQDSGFTSQDTLFQRPVTPSSLNIRHKVGTNVTSPKLHNIVLSCMQPHVAIVVYVDNMSSMHITVVLVRCIFMYPCTCYYNCIFL